MRVSARPGCGWGSAACLVLLGLDLGVFHVAEHTSAHGKLSYWTAVWIALALIFNAPPCSAGSGRSARWNSLTAT